MWTSDFSPLRGVRAHFAAPASLFAALLLAGCAHQSPVISSQKLWQQTLEQWADASVILLGEQHDQSSHHQWEADTVQQLASQGRLATLVIEMAPVGGSTAALSATASEEDVKTALRWSEGSASGGWPWKDYGPMVMHAVRAQVPVLGGNLPRAQMKQAMGESRYDSHLSAAGWQSQLDAIKDGHCGLLPPSQFTPMARIQLARDEAMASVVIDSVKRQQAPQKVVLLVAGKGHVRTDIGVPTWLPANIESKVAIAQSDKAPTAIKMQADLHLTLPATATPDSCEKLRQQWKNRTAKPAGAPPALPAQP